MDELFDIFDREGRQGGAPSDSAPRRQGRFRRLLGSWLDTDRNDDSDDESAPRRDRRRQHQESWSPFDL